MGPTRQPDKSPLIYTAAPRACRNRLADLSPPCECVSSPGQPPVRSPPHESPGDVDASNARSGTTTGEACGEHARDGCRHEHHKKQRRSHRRSASASAPTGRGLGSASPSPAAPAAVMEEERRLRRSPPVEARRQRERRRAREQPRCGEVAGGTAAECAAVCCCFPCAVVELVVLAAVRVPAALCRRALRARARRRRASRAAQAKKKEMAGLLASGATSPTAAAAKDINGDALDFCYWPAGAAAARRDELAEAEAAVWASFQGAGFWRSPSQRERRCSS